MVGLTSLLVVGGIVAAACSGSGGDGDTQSAEGAEHGVTAGAVAEEVEAVDAAAAPESSASPALNEAGDRGVIAGVDTTIRSVAPEDIIFDLFRGQMVSFAEASEETILDLVDAIPPLDANRDLLEPEAQQRVGTVRYITAEEAADSDFLWNTVLVVGYVADDGQPYAFPISILNFHEIVDETLGGRAVLITYCPLCRSGVVYERVLDGRVLNFGNTNALLQSDLVMFDRQTNSYWFQTGGEAVVGPLTGARLTVLPSVTVRWENWLEEHPDTLVLSSDTGFERPYHDDPFAGLAGAIEANRRTPFPVDSEILQDPRLPATELVVGVEVDGTARAYPITAHVTLAVNDVVAGQPVVVFIDAQALFGVAFDPTVDGRVLRFRSDDGAYVDAETGSSWDGGGRAVNGPLAGAQLRQLPSRTAFWFSYLSAFPEVTVAGVDTPLE